MEGKKIIEDVDFDKALAEFEAIDGGRTYKDIQEAVGELNDYDDGEEDVECGWCHEMWPETDCRYEVDLGYLCPQCEQEIKSRGEKLTFEEGHCKGHHCGEEKLDEKDCKKYKVITHSDDEEPVDCFGEKKPLDKPLTEGKDKSGRFGQYMKFDEFKAILEDMDIGKCVEEWSIGYVNDYDPDISFHDGSVCAGCEYIICSKNAGMHGKYVLAQRWSSDDGDLADGDEEEFDSIEELWNTVKRIYLDRVDEFGPDEDPSYEPELPEEDDDDDEELTEKIGDRYQAAYIDVSGSNMNRDWIESSKKILSNYSYDSLYYFADRVVAGKIVDEPSRNPSGIDRDLGLKFASYPGVQTNYGSVLKHMDHHDFTKVIVITDDDARWEPDGKRLLADPRALIINNRAAHSELTDALLADPAMTNDEFYKLAADCKKAGLSKEETDKKLEEAIRIKDDDGSETFIADEVIDQLNSNRDDVNDWVRQHDDRKIVKEDIEDTHTYEIRAEWLSDEEVEFCSDHNIILSEHKPYYTLTGPKDALEEFHDRFYPESTFELDTKSNNEDDIHGFETRCPTLDGELVGYCKEHGIGFDCDGRMSAFFGTIEQLQLLHDEFFPNSEFTIDGEPYISPEEKERLEAEYAADHWTDMEWDDEEIDDLSDEEKEMVKVMNDFQDDEPTQGEPVDSEYLLGESQEQIKESREGKGLYKRIYVTSDGAEDFGPIAAYSNGALWNGWECPFFEKADADKAMELSNELNVESEMTFDEESDAYYFKDFNYPDDPADEIKGLDIDTEDGTKHVYPIGAWSWTWYEADESQIDEPEEQLESKEADMNKKLIKEALEISDASVLDRLNGAAINHMKRGLGTIEHIDQDLIDADFNGVKAKLSTLICLAKGLITFEDPEIATYVESTVKPAIVDPIEQRNAEAKAQADAEAAMSDEERKELLIAKAEAKAEEDFAKGKEVYDVAIKNQKKYIATNSGIAMLANEVAASQAYIAKIEELKATAKAENSAAHKIETLVQATQALHTGEEDYAPYIKDIIFTLPVLDANATITPKQAKRTIAKMATLKKGLEAQFPEITSSGHFKEISKKENQNDWYNMWGLTGKVIFTKPVSELPASLQELISECTRISQDNAKNSATMTKNVTADVTEISNVYLAFALLNELGDWHLLDGEDSEIDQEAEEKPFDLF